MADKTENQIPNIPNLVSAEQFRRTEVERLRIQYNWSPVLFYGKCKDGKSFLPNAFLMELEARQSRQGCEPRMMLRFAKSCLRGEAAQWWEGCFLSYRYDQCQGPAKNYAAFKIAFKQRYGIDGSMADETERELLTAQGAGGLGPAHGQAPPKAAQGVQRTQDSREQEGWDRHMARHRPKQPRESRGHETHRSRGHKTHRYHHSLTQAQICVTNSLVEQLGEQSGGQRRHTSISMGRGDETRFVRRHGRQN
jgi:hypothetical protein